MTAILSRGRWVHSVTSATLNVASRHLGMCQTELLGKLVKVVSVGRNAYINGLVQERRNPSAFGKWSYIFLALTHRYVFSVWKSFTHCIDNIQVCRWISFQSKLWILSILRFLWYYGWVMLSSKFSLNENNKTHIILFRQTHIRLGI